MKVLHAPCYLSLPRPPWLHADAQHLAVSAVRQAVPRVDATHHCACGAAPHCASVDLHRPVHPVSDMGVRVQLGVFAAGISIV